MGEPRLLKHLATCVAAILLAALIMLTWQSRSGLAQLPDISVQTIEGRKINLRALQGSPLLVTFWATTCVTCVKKTPELKALYRKFQPGGLELIAVAMSYDPPNRILAFAKDHAVPYPIALDLDGTVARAFDDVSMTPTTFLVDTDGEVIFSKQGDINIAYLEQMISTILAGHAGKQLSRPGTGLQASL